MDTFPPLTASLWHCKAIFPLSPARPGRGGSFIPHSLTSQNILQNASALISHVVPGRQPKTELSNPFYRQAGLQLVDIPQGLNKPPRSEFLHYAHSFIKNSASLNSLVLTALVFHWCWERVTEMGEGQCMEIARDAASFPPARVGAPGASRETVPMTSCLREGSGRKEWAGEGGGWRG